VAAIKVADHLEERRIRDGGIISLGRTLWSTNLDHGGRTTMHRSKLPLTAWFWAAHLMATHSNGMSAQGVSRDQPIKPAQPLHIDEPESTG
jgi:hypothetical protein